MSIFDDIKDTGKDVFNKGKKAGQSADPSQVLDEVKEKLEEIKKIKDEVKELSENVKDAPELVKRKVEEGLKKIDDLTEEIARKVKKDFHDFVQSQIGKAFKRALEFAWQRVKKTKVLKSFGISVDFAVFTNMVGGGISISWDDVGDDKEILLKKIGSLSSSPPTSKEAIKDFIKVLAPDTVVFTVSAFSWGLSADEAIDEVDHWCNEIGFS